MIEHKRLTKQEIENLLALARRNAPSNDLPSTIGYGLLTAVVIVGGAVGLFLLTGGHF
jgi:hypothetical protein